MGIVSSQKRMNHDAFLEISVPLLQIQLLELASCFFLLYGGVRVCRFA
jgi:hypothetical protein